MRNDTPEDFLKRNNIKYKKTGKEAIIDCPECGKDSHCYLNIINFKWHCKRCDARGNEYSLKKTLGLQYEVSDSSGVSIEQHDIDSSAKQMLEIMNAPIVETYMRALWHDPRAQAARQYLQDRQIPIALAQAHCLGWAAQADGNAKQDTTRIRRAAVPATENQESNGWLVIPVFTKWNNNIPDSKSAKLIKFRSIPPAAKSYRRLSGGESVLYCPNGISDSETLIIVGGEIDALSVIAAGHNNVISGTLGETAWDDKWSDKLEDCDDIVIVYDNDDAGIKGAAMVAEKIGNHKVRIGKWPDGCKDANESLCKYGSNFDIGKIISSAKSSDGDSVLKIGDLRESYKRSILGNAKPRGISTGWPDLDNLMGGVRDGEVTLITGDTASGKSTFASQWALQMAISGVNTLVCPFEMGAHRQLDKWVRQWSNSAPDNLTPERLDSVLDSLQAAPIWILNRYGSIRLEPMRNTLIYAIRKLGIKFVLVDHIHFMVEEGPNERNDLDSMMKMLAEIAVDTRIHIIVVAHPRQHSASDEKHRDNRIIQMSDLKGSSGLKQMSDNILSVWRPRKADRTGVTENGVGVASIYMLKARSDFATEGSIAFKFILESARFEAPDSNMISMFRNAMSNVAENPDTPNNITGPPQVVRARPRRVAQTDKVTESSEKYIETKHWTAVYD